MQCFCEESVTPSGNPHGICIAACRDSICQVHLQLTVVNAAHKVYALRKLHVASAKRVLFFRLQGVLPAMSWITQNPRVCPLSAGLAIL